MDDIPVPPEAVLYASASDVSWQIHASRDTGTGRPTSCLKLSGKLCACGGTLRQRWRRRLASPAARLSEVPGCMDGTPRRTAAAVRTAAVASRLNQLAAMPHPAAGPRWHATLGGGGTPSPAAHGARGGATPCPACLANSILILMYRTYYHITQGIFITYTREYFRHRNIGRVRG